MVDIVESASCHQSQLGKNTDWLYYLEAIIQQVVELKGKIGGAMIPQEVRYADDVALVTTTRQELERTSRSSERYA